MSLASFCSGSKHIETTVHIDHLAWFENSIHDGVVILGIFRDAIAMSASSYVRQIAEKTLRIIRGIALTRIDDSTLRVSFQRLGEATAAVTATVLQSYLKSPSKDEWPGSQLQGILENLVKLLDFIEVWISSGQAKETFGRRKCLKMIKQCQKQLSGVMERFQLASLLRSYTVLPFVKRLVEEYAQSLQADTGQTRITAADTFKALPGIPTQGDQNQLSVGMYGKDKEAYDPLRVKVELLLRLIEKEENSRLTTPEISSVTQQIATHLSQYSEENGYTVTRSRTFLEKFSSEDKTDFYDNLREDAEELLYDLLMAKFSKLAIFGPNKPLPFIRPYLLSSTSTLPPSYSCHDTSNQSSEVQTSSNGQSMQQHSSVTHLKAQMALNKPLPPLIVDNVSRTYVSNGSRAENIYERNRSLNQVLKERSTFPSLPPGAMPPFVSTTPLLSHTSGLVTESGMPTSSLNVNGAQWVYRNNNPVNYPTVSINVSTPMRYSLSNYNQVANVLPSNQRIPFTQVNHASLSNSSYSSSLLFQKPRNILPLPPGAMPPILNSPPPFEEVDHGPHLIAPPPVINPVPVMPLNVKRRCQPISKRCPNLSPILERQSEDFTIDSDLEDERESTIDYHLPPIEMHSPISLPPSLQADSQVSHDVLPYRRLPQPPPPPRKRPKNIGPGYEYLRTLSPHMQRYVGDLEDRIW